MSLGEKANLRKFLESWRGRKFTSEELKGFGIEKLLGANCVLNIVHTDRGYDRIASVMPLMRGVTKLQPENPLLAFDLDHHNVFEPLPERIPQWLRERIIRSDEWVAREANGTGAYADDGAPPPNADDDIPF